MAGSQLPLLDNSISSTSDAKQRVLFWRKWVGFVSAIWLMVFSASYSFSNYSEELKEVLGINQKSLNRLGIARDLGDACGGIIAGYLSNYLPPWVLLCFSGLASVIGFGIQWLVVSQTTDPFPYWIIFISLMIGGTVMSWMNSAVFNASVRNFKRNSGPVAGLLKACMGLSGAVFATICSSLFASSASVYLMMVVTIPTAFCIISAIFFRPVPSAATHEEEQIEHKSLTVFNVIACILAIYIAIVDFIPESLSSISASQYIVVFLLIAIIASPGLVPVIFFLRMKKGEPSHEGVRHNGSYVENGSMSKGNIRDSSVGDHDFDLPKSERAQENVENSALTKPLLESNACSMKANEKLACCGYFSSLSLDWIAQGIGEETSTLTLFKKWHAFALFISFVCGCGCGVSFSNNLGQIGQSFGFSSVSILISLFSLGNFVGRLASGNISEYFLRVAGLPRPAWIGVAKVPMILLFVLLSGGSQVSLYVGSLVIGISHGSLITLFIPTVSEFYGLKHFGTNFVILGLYFLTGSLSFSSMSGWLYDYQAAKQSDSESLTCYGSDCYGTSFLIFASCLTVALD
ncbi:hypothetical protein GOP47_0027552 [Adiantum capillus-veneris]|nr:hypothetical protein GOP47_0027552 [Adiantum capillus-veneris]